MYKVLFATSEAYPLIKTGGLADVSGSLPPALTELGHDVRLVLPAYGDVKAQPLNFKPVAQFDLPQGSVTILEGVLPGADTKVWLVDHPGYFHRMGNPYLGPDGHPWHDNADRYALFSRVIVELACDRAGLGWKPDVVHCNDWQTGLVPALLKQEKASPPSVFTVHNLAYQGLFPYSTFVALGLPASFWSFDALEFHGQLSFIKGGLAFADRITAVSPTYAKEIQTPEFGYGLEGLLQYRRKELVGILNGVDMEAWNPESDPYLDYHYSISDMAGKLENKEALQKEYGLAVDENALLIGMVGRLVHQKGIDLVLDILPEIMDLPVQLVLLGSGDPMYEHALQTAAQHHASQMGIYIGYNEAGAHHIEAGADLFLMPSRFEPCGLNQMYSLRYGTLPLVRRVGGLADTVIDATPANLKKGKANGIVFAHDHSHDLLKAIQRGVELFQKKKEWAKVQRAAMQCDFSWKKSAKQYVKLYKDLGSSVQDPGS